MANFLVFVEVRDGAATLPSRLAVAEARRLANEVGATVYALVTVGAADDAVISRIARAVTAGGADRILCCADARFATAPPLDITVGPILLAASSRLRPRLTLFPGGGVGAELGAPLAARTGATYFPHAALDEIGGSARGGLARILLRRRRGTSHQVQAIDLAASPHPVVATLEAREPRPSHGRAVDDVEMIPAAEATSALRGIDTAPDPDGALDTAAVALWVDGALTSEERAALAAACPSGTCVSGGGDGPGPAGASPHRLLVVHRRAGRPSLPPGFALAPGAHFALATEDARDPPPGAAVWRSAEALAPLLAALERRRAGESSRAVR